MRIADTTRLASALAHQVKVASQQHQAMTVASTGLRVVRPSDDPTAFAESLKQGAAIERLGARRETTAATADHLELAEGVLANASDLLVRAKELAVQLSNGSIDGAARADAISEVRGIRETLLGFANQKGPEGYLFGGTGTSTPPFDAAGNFVGNDNRKEIEIADGVTARGNPSGAKAFTIAGGVDAFQALSAFDAALGANDQNGIRSAIDGLTKAHSQLVSNRIETGTAAARFRSASDVIDGTLVSIRAAHAATVEADPATAYSQLVDLQAAYERSLAVTKRLLSLSAMNPGG